MTLLSVVTVAWNAEATIADTMASVAAQDCDDFEHIVVDGASDDRTLAIVRDLATSRTTIVSEPDCGIYDAMNKGAALARGEYLGFLNADDFLVRTDALSRIAQATAGIPDAVAAGAVIVDSARPERWRRSYSATHFRPYMLRFGHMPPHPGFYARTEHVRRLGPFRTDLRISADFDWMLRFHLAGLRQCAIPETLVAVREGGASNNGFASRKTIAHETGKALRDSGIWTAPPLLWGKYAAKISQFVVPPHEYPAPSPVRWMPAKAAVQEAAVSG